MIFIDTDLAIGFLSNKSTEKNILAKKILNALFETHEKVYLTIFNSAELIRGAYISSKVAQNLRIVEEFVQQFTIMPFNEVSVTHYAKIYADLQNQGKTIGDFDELIASIVIAHDGTLYTNNLDHFGKITLLHIVDWATPENKQQNGN